jgi:MPBQ/MSBQ methyltransferase|tara:strand:+ start:353 stop:532 length:180 start_codon:yes stop_codon:yes gene_type:complete
MAAGTLAHRFPRAEVTGITISPEQQKRATDLAEQRGVPNAKFELCDAMDMKYASRSRFT